MMPESEDVMAQLCECVSVIAVFLDDMLHAIYPDSSGYLGEHIKRAHGSLEISEKTCGIKMKAVRYVLRDIDRMIDRDVPITHAFRKEIISELPAAIKEDFDTCGKEYKRANA